MLLINMITYGLVKQVGPYAQDYPSSYKPSNTETIVPKYPYVSVVGNGTKSLHAQRLVPDSTKGANPKYSRLKFVPQKKDFQLNVILYQPSVGGPTEFGNTFGVETPPPSSYGTPSSGGPPSLLNETASEPDSFATASEMLPSPIVSEPGSPRAGLQEVLDRATQASNELLRQREQLGVLMQNIQPGVWDPSQPIRFDTPYSELRQRAEQIGAEQLGIQPEVSFDPFNAFTDQMRSMDERLAETISNQETKSQVMDEIKSVYESKAMSDLKKEFGSDLVQELIDLRASMINDELDAVSQQSREVTSQIAAMNTRRGSSLLSQASSLSSRTKRGIERAMIVRYPRLPELAVDIGAPAVPAETPAEVVKKRLQETRVSLNRLAKTEALKRLEKFKTQNKKPYQEEVARKRREIKKGIKLGKQDLPSSESSGGKSMSTAGSLYSPSTSDSSTRSMARRFARM